MVNNQNPYLALLTRLPPPPDIDDLDISDRFISKECLWDLDELIQICGQSEKSYTMVTRKAEKDFENLEENNFDLPTIIKELKINGIFKNSWWCKTSPSINHRTGKRRGKGFWAPCDAYSLTTKFYNPKNNYSGTVNYFFKMAKALDGSAVIFVSLHV